MGEPFRPTSRGDDPLADWFRQADANHDGYLTADELVKDADRFFATLDVNHDGQIDPDEIDRYEHVVAPEVQGEPVDLRGPPDPTDSDADMSDVDPDAGETGTRIKSGGDDDHGPAGAGRYSLLNIPEPVAGADTDLSRSVSREEFRQAAIRRFGLLDTQHLGRLTLAQLEGERPAATHERSGSSQSGSSSGRRGGGRHRHSSGG